MPKEKPATLPEIYKHIWSVECEKKSQEDTEKMKRDAAQFKKDHPKLVPYAEDVIKTILKVQKISDMLALRMFDFYLADPKTRGEKFELTDDDMQTIRFIRRMGT